MESKKITCWVKPCTRLSASYEDFAGGEEHKAEKWRGAYFELLSWKNTWCVPFLLDIGSTRKGNGYYEPFVTMLIPTEKAESVIGYMEDYGYRNIEKSNANVLVVDSMEGFYAFGDAYPTHTFFEDEVE